MLIKMYVFSSVLFVTAIAVPVYYSNEVDDGRVVNGTTAPPGKYPSQVSIQPFDGSHSCGGSILNQNWVLTAAHCVYLDHPNYVNILAGTVILDEGGTVHLVVDIQRHENFSYNTLQNDIALLKVEPAFIWDNMTKPVTLPLQDQETPGGSPATVIGWGYPYTGGSVMNNLQEVDYWVVNDQECMEAHNLEIYPTNICAYYPGGGKGQCSGDSGGPLFVNGYQAGIVSWSEKPCTIAPYPGVFTEVSPYINWIYSHIK